MTATDGGYRQAKTCKSFCNKENDRTAFSLLRFLARGCFAGFYLKLDIHTDKSLFVLLKN